MKFGTSGLRGLVTEMTDAACESHVAAFLRHLARGSATGAEVLVARDLRPSSPRIAAACLRAIRIAGLRAIDCGALPTPALALEAARRGAPAVMVTGSHIPFDRNGLKLYRPEGEITKIDETGILAELGAPSDLPRTPRGEAAIETDAGARYVDRLCGFFGADLLAGRRIGVYQHSAVGRDLVVEALSRLGADIVALGRCDDFTPVDTEAVRAEDRALAERWTAEHGLDALVSTDGDGDRPLVADETGRFLRGDALGILAARFLGADAVATPITSNSGLERCGWFARIARTPIGSPFVIEAIARLRAEGARVAVGFEANGGFILGDVATRPHGRTLPPLPTRDALTPMLCALAGAAERGIPLSALAALLPARATASDRLPQVAPSASQPFLAAFAHDAALQARVLGGIRPAAVDMRDGVRVTLPDGDVVHLRASGNAPELRCYAEAETETQAARLVARTLASADAELARLAG